MGPPYISTGEFGAVLMLITFTIAVVLFAPFVIIRLIQGEDVHFASIGMLCLFIAMLTFSVYVCFFEEVC